MKPTLILLLITACAANAELRLGIIGTDTSHVSAFTKILNDEMSPDHIPGARIVAAYKGMNAGGGPKGVGDAVNESVVITFMLLFVANFVMSAIYFQLVPPKTG